MYVRNVLNHGVYVKERKMICIVCKREIERSYGLPGMNGCYCERCVKLTPEYITQGITQINNDIAITILTDENLRLKVENKNQEQRIFELENRLKECENGYEGTLYLDRCKLHDADEKIKKLTAEISSLVDDCKIAEKLISEKSEEIARLKKENKTLTINMNAFGLASKRLVEENESLRDKAYRQECDKWLNTDDKVIEDAISQATQATIRKMQERVKQAFRDDGRSNLYIRKVIDQVAEDLRKEREDK